VIDSLCLDQKTTARPQRTHLANSVAWVPVMVRVHYRYSGIELQREPDCSPAGRKV
jgi:hypothetical protein